MSFAPNTNASAAQLAATANAAKRGETSNIGTMLVPGGSGVYTLQDVRLGVGKVLLLSPANTAAAACRWYVPAVMNGTADIHFYEPPSVDAAFSYAIVGEGNTKGL